MSQIPSSVTFQLSRENKILTFDDYCKLGTDECEKRKPNNAIKARIWNGIIDKVVSQRGPRSVGRI